MTNAAIIAGACVFCFLNGLALGAWLKREERADQVRALTSRNEDLTRALKGANEDLMWAFETLFAQDERLRKYDAARDELRGKAEAMLGYCDQLRAEQEAK